MMLARSRQRELDQLILIYLDAVEGGNLPIIRELWQRAEGERDLSDALTELNEALEAEERATLSPSEPRFCDVALALDTSASILTDHLRLLIEPLPRDLSLRTLLDWAKARNLPAERGYWQAFQRTAMQLRSQQAPSTGLAAREAEPDDNAP